MFLENNVLLYLCEIITFIIIIIKYYHYYVKKIKTILMAFGENCSECVYFLLIMLFWEMFIAEVFITWS